MRIRKLISSLRLKTTNPDLGSLQKETFLRVEKAAKRDTSHKEVSLAVFISICNDGWI